MKILLINGNTTETITAKMADTARRAARSGTEIVPVTATFGARIVSSRSENVIAAHAVLVAAARHYQDCDAVVLGISLDTGLGALRELLPIPSIGMTEAAALVACTLGGRFGVITLGTRSLAMYEEVLAGYGLERRVAGVEGIDIETRDYGDSHRIGESAVVLANKLIKERGAESIVLAGAAMAGQHAELQARVPVPLLDGITCGVHLAEVVAGMKLKKASVGSHSHPGAKELVDSDPALAELFRRGGKPL
jgi:allantoin racemase